MREECPTKQAKEVSMYIRGESRQKTYHWSGVSHFEVVMSVISSFANNNKETRIRNVS